MKKIIIIGCDHNGLVLKEFIIKNFKKNFFFVDVGCFDISEKVDYSDYARVVAKNVGANPANFIGVLICGTGVGMCLSSNKIKNVRAVLAHNLITAKKSREHNDTNIICIGSWINTNEENLEILKVWINTKFGYGRHTKRVEKIEEGNNYKIAFVNGVFDILHHGHIELLKFAKSLAQKVIVGLNSDISVKKIKGNNRPINNFIDRKNTLLSIQYVDEVIGFTEIKPTKLIRSIMPDLIVRGSDFSEKLVRKRDKIPSSIKIKILNKKIGYSTTNIIKRFQK